MNKLIKLEVGVALVLFVVFGGLGTVIADSPPAPAAPGSTYDQRLVQRKQERGIVLSTTDQARLINTCITGQGNIRVIENAMVPILANRTTVYQQVDAKLWVTIGQLKLANRDTFKLEGDRLTLAGKTANFQSIASNFTQTLDDIQVINCKADTAGFKALIDTARLYYTQLQAQSADSRDYIVNTVKPELANHIAGLQTKTSTGGGN